MMLNLLCGRGLTQEDEKQGEGKAKTRVEWRGMRLRWECVRWGKLRMGRG